MNLHLGITDDYGWIEPDGTFHQVEWGEHQEWAAEYIQNEEKGVASAELAYNAGDILAKRGWVLLHSPAQGVAFPTIASGKRYTKAQKEFLFGYYADRGMNNEAREIYDL